MVMVMMASRRLKLNSLLLMLIPLLLGTAWAGAPAFFLPSLRSTPPYHTVQLPSW